MTCLLIFLCNVCAQAEQTVRVAVSANFTNTMHALTRLFNEQHQCRIQTSAASTAMLSLQIEQGANFDLFFSADKQHASDLVKKKLAVENSQYTYATGQLVLWVPNQNLSHPKIYLRKHWLTQRWSLPNPKVAPYGIAAKQVLNTLGLSYQNSKTVVLANNVTGAYLYVHQRIVPGGFIALSQIKQKLIKQHYLRKHMWLIPKHYYQPLVQDMVILKQGRHKACVHKFYQFIKTIPAQHIISEFGYQV